VSITFHRISNRNNDALVTVDLGGNTCPESALFTAVGYPTSQRTKNVSALMMGLPRWVMNVLPGAFGCLTFYG
jgi:hypothetical protein